MKELCCKRLNTSGSVEEQSGLMNPPDNPALVHLKLQVGLSL